MQNQNKLDLIITYGYCIKDIEFQDPIGKSDHVVIKFKCILETDKSSELPQQNLILMKVSIVNLEYILHKILMKY